MVKLESLFPPFVCLHTNHGIQNLQLDKDKRFSLLLLSTLWNRFLHQHPICCMLGVQYASEGPVGLHNGIPFFHILCSVPALSIYLNTDDRFQFHSASRFHKTHIPHYMG